MAVLTAKAPAKGGERPGRGRRRRLIVAAAVAAVSFAVAVVLAVVAVTGGGGEGEPAGPPPTMPSTTMATGGIEVPVPEGWSAAPVPDMGFGIGLPPRWEAAVLSDEMLASLQRSSPAVPGFVEAAHAAARSGSVFYAAGADDDGRISDFKVRVAPRTGVTDIAGLEDYARQLASAAGLADPTIERVDGAERPTVRVRFQTQARSEEETVTTEGTETLVLGPRNAVWSIIVTSEDPETHDELASQIVATLTFAE